MEKFAIAFRRVLVNDPDSLFSETRIRIKYKLKRLENDYTQNESKKSETTDRRVKRMIENVRFSFSDRFLSFSLRALFGTKERTYVLLRLLLAHTRASPYIIPIMFENDRFESFITSEFRIIKMRRKKEDSCVDCGGIIRVP